MSSLKEIKTRINSVKSTLKITSAMKMVAAAKLHKAQNAIGNKLPYEQQLRRTLAGMLEDDDLQKALHDELGLGDPDCPLVMLEDIHADEYPVKEHAPRVALVLFSSNSSLCGAFNANVIREFHHTLDVLMQRGYSHDDIDVYSLGRKIGESAVKSGLTLKRDLSAMSDRPSYDDAAELASVLTDSYISGEVSQVIFIYSHFATAASQPVVRENYLPLALHDLDKGDPVDYILEPDPLSLARELLPLVLRLKLYTVLLDANAAEHAARTIAMQIASDNAKNLIAELTLAYNKGRQQEITAEILDLVGGTMA
ncbi:MAG: ATP synthase F1 subunit gamma [Bacteroidales bacterium]|nr:ATP synthase F1 subunit gamma [Bacteroidales bacterium]